MRKLLLISVILIAGLISSPTYAANYSADTMRAHPERYIKITDWSVYATWGAVAIIHHVTIENTSDVEYRDVKVRVCYSSMTGGTGTIVSQEVGVLPVTLPPRSKKTYLRKGATIGAGSQFMTAVDIQVLSATPVLE